jgi:4-hydroxy-4-methyl-2-oxoglutarate aldolase
MNAQDFDMQYRARLMALATSNLSDALDQLQIRGAVIGVLPMWGSTKIVGRAQTIRMTATGMTKSTTHLGVDAIAASSVGDVIVIDNRGDIHNNCWGEILSMGAHMKGVSGVVIDGAARDIDMCEAFNFPVHARAAVPITARGRIAQEAWNIPIRLGDVQVRPGDVVVADINGVVILPAEKVSEIIEAAEQLASKEAAMVEALRRGESITEVDRRFNYEQMLNASEKSL